MKKPIFIMLMLVVMACTPQPTAIAGPDSPVISPSTPGDNMPTNEPVLNPFAPKPEDKDLARGIVYLKEASLVIRESFPPQVSLMIQGALPTPCNQLRADIRPPDAQNKIEVDLYSVIDPNKVCIEVLEPFEEAIDLGTFTTGHYTVWVNGERVGEFDT